MTEPVSSGTPSGTPKDLPDDLPAWHVVLVGLPGTGKTSVGRRLAKELERPFADVDEQVELAAGTSIRRLFREQGEGPFRALETQVLTQLLGHPAPLVLAAGGGIVTRPENRALLGGAADDHPGASSPSHPRRHPVWVVWLRASAEFLAARTDPAHRPLLAADPVGALTRLEAERGPLYAEVADEVVDVEPFHAPGDDEDAPAAVKPKHALARHIVQRLARSAFAGSGSPAAATTERGASA